MRSYRLLVCCLTLLAAAPVGNDAVALADSFAGELNWKSGGNLPGQLLGATSTHVRWQSNAFPIPFLLQLPYLESIKFQEADAAGPSGSLRFRTRNGDVLYGELVDIGADGQVVISSRRHGEVRLALTELRSFRRFDDPAMAYFGPTGTIGWRTISAARFTSEWKRNSDGQISTSVYGAELYRDLKLGDLAEIDISLRWGRRPGFLLSFVDPKALRLSQDAVRLETKNNQVVLQTIAPNGNVQVIAQLSRRTTSLELRLIWNQLTGELAAYSPAGKLLGKITARPTGSQGHSGLFIRNRGSDLTIEHLRVNDEGGRSAIRLFAGDVIYGQVRSFEKSSGSLLLEEPGGQTRRFPLDQVAVGYLGDAEAETVDAPEVQLSYYDGTLLRGKLDSIQGGVILVDTAYSERPVAAELAGAQELLFLQPSPQPQYLASLELTGARLQGRLAPAGESGKELGWEPLGSLEAAPIPNNRPARFVQDLMERARHSRGPVPKDVVYLTNGDVLRAQVQAVNESMVEGATIFSATTQLPLASVKAIDFDSSPQRANRSRGPRQLVAEGKNAFLTVPRQRRENPPTHALAAKNGDWLRGKLVSVLGDTIRFALPLGEVDIPRDRLASIVWLEHTATERETDDSLAQADLIDGSQLTFAPRQLVDGNLLVDHSALGDRRLPLNAVREIKIGHTRLDRGVNAYSDWVLQLAKDPRFVEQGAVAGQAIGKRSSLVGAKAAPIVAALLDGNSFKLADFEDRIVVLDFWATWCAPCVRSLPHTEATVKEFAADAIFVAVNQQQDTTTIRDFLSGRDLAFTVALDPESKVAQEFDVKAIPQTVIIGRGGIIQRLYVGDVPGLQGLIRETLQELTNSTGG